MAAKVREEVGIQWMLNFANKYGIQQPQILDAFADMRAFWAPPVQRSAPELLNEAISKLVEVIEAFEGGMDFDFNKTAKQVGIVYTADLIEAKKQVSEIPGLIEHTKPTNEKWVRRITNQNGSNGSTHS